MCSAGRRSSQTRRRVGLKTTRTAYLNGEEPSSAPSRKYDLPSCVEPLLRAPVARRRVEMLEAYGCTKLWLRPLDGYARQKSYINGRRHSRTVRKIIMARKSTAPTAPHRLCRSRIISMHNLSPSAK